MTLRKKTLLIIGLTLVTLLVALFMPAYRIIFSSFSELEQHETIQDVNRAVDSLRDNEDQLDRITQDWASWDDTYNFVQDRDEAFISSNLELDTSWINNDLNVMVFLNRQGETVFAEAFDHDKVEKIPLPADLMQHLQPGSPLLDVNEESGGVKGVLMLEQGPMLVAAEPILTSEREGPSRGWLIWGRTMDDAQIQYLSQVAHLSVAMQRLDREVATDFSLARTSIDELQPVSVSPLGENSIAGYSVLKDIYGNDAIMLRTDAPRDILSQGKSMIRYILATIFAATLFFGVGTFFLLERSVLSRVSRLSSEVSAIGEIGDHSIRIEMSGKDELTRLADVINKALAALEHSQHELKKAHDNLELKVAERTAELREKVAVLQALTDIDREIISTNDPVSILDLVTQRAAQLLQCPKALISLCNSEKCHVAARMGMDCSDDELEELKQIDWHETGDGAQNMAMTSNAPETQALMPEFYEREHLQSAIIAPLVAEGNILGSLLVADTQPRNWSVDELQVMRLLSAEAALSYDEARLFEEEQARREELGSLYSLSRSLVEASPQSEEILDLVTKHAVENIRVTFARVLVTDAEHFVIGAGYPIRTLGVDIKNGLKETAESMPVCSHLLRSEGPVVLSVDDPEIDDREKRLLFMGVAHRLCVVPIRGERVYGLLMLGEARSQLREPFSPEKIRLAHSIGDQTASALRRAELFTELERSYLETVMTLAKAVEAKDNYTADHAESLAKMALAIGAAMHMNAEEMEDLRYGAILHDVGKIGVPDDVLQKPGKLDDEEWKKMKQHPQIGAEILDPVPRLRGASQIVRHHHEHFNGNGYPDGLKGEEIPLGARILTVVDSYSAIVDDRVYKKGRSHEEALAELERCAGSQFDPIVVSHFTQLFRQDVLH